MYCLSNSLTSVPVKLEFLGYVLDGRRAATPPHIVGKALGVKRIVCQKLQPLPLHFAAASTMYPTNLELQVHPGIPTRQIPHSSCSSVVPATLHPCATAACRFFDRRTRLIMRAFGSPKIPRTVGCTRNPLNAYVSHNRRTRFFDVAIATPCQNSRYPKMLQGRSSSGFHTDSRPKFTHSNTRRSIIINGRILTRNVECSPCF